LRPIFPKGRHKGKGKTLNEIVYASKPLPDGWVRYVHLDGKPYFRHEGRRIVTEANIADLEQKARVDMIYAHLHKQVEILGNIELGDNYELYVDLDHHHDDKFAYYFVDHSTQDLFWLNDINLEDYDLVDDGEPIDMNYDVWIMRNYYRHLEHFPCHNTLPPDAALFLHGALSYTCTGKH